MPSYAILSHRWDKDEVLFKHMDTGIAKQRDGFEKIRRCCREAETFGVDYVWVDTCCIDKSSSAELSEAINSMFRWYQQSFLCLVYLSDVDSSSKDARAAFRNSVWFTRGWTLQELIAPRTIEFYDSQWRCMGDMDALRRVVSETTSIPLDVLSHRWPLRRYPIAQRMSWAASRQTTRIEDRAYSLMGLFDINMPMLYGEGENAFRRLQEEIVKTCNDTSILFWTGNPLSLFATSPSAFNLSRACGSLFSKAPTGHFGGWYSLMSDGLGREGFNTESSTITNLGLSVSMPLFPWYFDMYLGLVAVVNLNQYSSWYCFIYLSRSPSSRSLHRSCWQGENVRCMSKSAFQNMYRSPSFDQLTSRMRQVVIASEGRTFPAYENNLHHAPGTVAFIFDKSSIWGIHGVPYEADIITCNAWNPDLPTLRPVAPCQLLAIFRLTTKARQEKYLYVGYDEDFRLCLVMGAWSWPYSAYGDWNYVKSASNRTVSNLLQPVTFWSWFGAGDPENIDWTIRAYRTPTSAISRILHDLGICVRVECSAVSSYTVSFKTMHLTTMIRRNEMTPPYLQDNALESNSASISHVYASVTNSHNKHTQTD